MLLKHDSPAHQISKVVDKTCPRLRLGTTGKSTSGFGDARAKTIRITGLGVGYVGPSLNRPTLNGHSPSNSTLLILLPYVSEFLTWIRIADTVLRERFSVLRQRGKTISTSH